MSTLLQPCDAIRVQSGHATAPQRHRDYATRLTVTIARMTSWWERALARRRSRLHLLELDDAQLADICITPAEARREGLRPFWD